MFFLRVRYRFGGARRVRTADLYNAIVALSQLSYGPRHTPVASAHGPQKAKPPTETAQDCRQPHPNCQGHFGLTGHFGSTVFTRSAAREWRNYAPPL